MNKLSLIGSLVLLGVAASGCNKPQSAADVNHEVAVAQADKNKEVADARSDQARNVDEKMQDANTASAKGDYTVAIAKADGNYKIAKEACSALSGSEQSSCKERAELDLKAAKAHAEELQPKT